jgi:hypothetical protein
MNGQPKINDQWPTANDQRSIAGMIQSQTAQTRQASTPLPPCTFRNFSDQNLPIKAN